MTKRGEIIPRNGCHVVCDSTSTTLSLFRKIPRRLALHPPKRATAKSIRSERINELRQRHLKQWYTHIEPAPSPLPVTLRTPNEDDPLGSGLIRVHARVPRNIGHSDGEILKSSAL